jgi:antitoxin ParD1/3/4
MIPDHLLPQGTRPMTVSIALPEELIGIIKRKVASSRYASASEVLREALRLLDESDQQEAEQIERLRHAWDEGIGSGDAGVLDFDELRAAARWKRAGRG